MNSDTLQTIKSIAAIGGWVIISLFFMGQSAGYISSSTDRHLATMETQIQLHDESLEEHRKRQEVLIDRLTTALRVLCENSARGNTEAYNNCMNIK